MTASAPYLEPTAEVTCVAGQTFCVSGSSGQIRGAGRQGLFVRDARVLNRLVVRIDGIEPLPLRGQVMGSDEARFTGCWPPQREHGSDPRLFLDRRRVVSASLWEDLRLTNFGQDALRFVLEVEAGSDFASVFDIKHGRTQPPAPVLTDGESLRLAAADRPLATSIRPSISADEYGGARMRWFVELDARDTWTLALSIGAESPEGRAWPARPRFTTVEVGERMQDWQIPVVRASDPRFSELLQQSVEDLASLLVADPADPADRYFAAGSPWYLTLFGRDSLWTALMALPLSVDAAGQTLRVLARRQGTCHDPETEEAPGRILHEVRHGALAGRGDLPPTYYGTMDATPLFVVLLHEAWRWGLPEDQVEALLPHVVGALRWMRDDGDPDGDGFLEYAKADERGLTNQGWKDSEDGVQFADGRLAEPPIALCEVQGYAHDAALRGAELLDHFGQGGPEEWRMWAARLRDRFRAAFWVDGPAGAYPAIALDGRGRRVDSITSNIGHLPASGLLSTEECRLVARRLAAGDMSSGWGLRTLSTSSPRFNPLSYHGGSVWPHDTAIAVANLAATGHHHEAGALLRALAASSQHFDFRLPELFGGEQRLRGAPPLPYPAACRPQAWAAGAALLLARAALGVNPNVPQGRLELAPMWPPPYRRLHLQGLDIGGERLSLSLERDTGLAVHESPASLRLEVRGVPLAADAQRPAAAATRFRSNRK